MERMRNWELHGKDTDHQSTAPPPNPTAIASPTVISIPGHETANVPPLESV